MHQAKQAFHKNRHEECKVDKERGEMITKRRLMAIERIERETREKEAALEKKMAEVEQGGTEVQKGDAKALEEYQKKWATKLSLHGIDGVREQIAPTVSSSEPCGDLSKVREKALAQATQRAREAEAFAFRPPDRFSEAPDSGGHGGSRAAEGVEDHRSSSSRTQPLSVTNFISGRSSVTSGDMVESLQDRQFAVLGDNPWVTSSRGAGQDRAGGSASAIAKTDNGEVIPDIWKNHMAQCQEAEKDCFEQNQAITERMMKDQAASGGSGSGGGGEGGSTR